ncbi:MAG: hypothetical protein WBQ60_07530 [Asticcacaulis sp.]
MTHEIDTDLKEKLRQWPLNSHDFSPPGPLIETAMSHAQIIPFGVRIRHELELAFTQWAYALPYKLGAAATCLMIGAGLGGLLEEPVNVAGLALMSLTGTGL